MRVLILRYAAEALDLTWLLANRYTLVKEATLILAPHHRPVK
jgi:hypothetical protein